MNSILQILQVVLLGNADNGKVRLQKKPTKEDHIQLLNSWVQRNFYIIALVTIIFLLIAFIFVCFAIVGISSVESGIPYNHMQEII